MKKTILISLTLFAIVSCFLMLTSSYDYYIPKYSENTCLSLNAEDLLNANLPNAKKDLNGFSNVKIIANSWQNQYHEVMVTFSFDSESYFYMSMPVSFLDLRQAKATEVVCD